MPEVAVVTDSSACLPDDLVREYGITIVPLALLFDGDLYHDGALSSAEFYERLAACRKPPSTTSPAPGEFLEAFRRLHASGVREIVCLTLSSRYSGTYSAARNGAEMAERELPGLRLRVVDTNGLAMTHGFAVLAAARAIRGGAAAEEAAEVAESVGKNAHLVGVLETTRYLARSGRVPWIVHWAASALSIKPILAATGTEIGPIARVRTIAKGIERMIQYVADHSAGNALHVAVMHANAPERAEDLASKVRVRFTPVELLVTEFTSVMGIHTGPGFVGLAFYSGDELATWRERRHGKDESAQRDAETLETALGALPPPQSRPCLVILSGLPGSGKSYLARELRKRVPFVILQSDAMRKTLFERPAYTDEENARLFPAMHVLLDRLLARHIAVIYDATNLREEHRRPLYEIAEKNAARLVVVQVTAPEDVALRRLERRLRERDPDDRSDAGPAIYTRMRSEVEPIGRRHLVVDTSSDVQSGVDMILRELQEVSV
jgi:DegV family protein with EDD domain